MANIFQDLKYTYNKPSNSHIQLIIINCSIFVFIYLLRFVLFLSGNLELFISFIELFTLPADLSDLVYRPWALVTHFFFELSFFSLFFNMICLYFYGQLLIGLIGSKKFLSVYLFGGLVGGLTFLLFSNILPAFRDNIAIWQVMGPLGGVTAIVIAAATHLPNSSIHLFFLGPVKLVYLALFYLFMTILMFVERPQVGLLEIGGAFLAFVYIKQMHKGRDIGKWINNFISWVSSLFSKKKKIKVAYKKTDSNKRRKEKVVHNSKGMEKASKTEGQGIPNQAEIDAILDKISDKGYESLSKEEKQKLFNASNK